MKNQILLSVASLLFVSQLSAQSYLDAQLFSETNVIGTARTASMSGAFGALGADISSLSTNPAGLGLYQSVDFSFTLDLGISDRTSYYSGNKFTSRIGDLNLNSLGIAFPVKSDPDSDWKRQNFGFAYNKIKDFRANTVIYGNDDNSSLVDVFFDNANGNTLDELDSFFELSAFDTDLIDLDVDSNGFIDNGQYFREVYSGQDQYKEVITDGQIGEIVFSYAGSYQEKLYLGSSLSISTVEYIRRSKYTENNFNDTLSTVQSFNFYENQYTTGSGIGLKFGAIYKANKNLRLGLSWHSPSILYLNDEYETRLDVNHSFNDSAYAYSKSSPYGMYDYQVNTPSKLMFSGALILSKQFVVSADFELVDYSEVSLGGQPGDEQYFNDQNTIIQNRYGEVANMKLGAELNLSKVLLRAGYASYGNPLGGDLTSTDPTASVYSTEKEMYSVGFGKRNKFSYVDFAFVFSEGSYTTWLYNAYYTPPVKVVSTNYSLLLTMGWKF
jgi:long-subunit fatty acid transport protein